MRISEFILRDEGPEAQGKELLAFSLKSAAGGRSSNLIKATRVHEPIIPVFHYSNIPAGVERVVECSRKHVEQRGGAKRLKPFIIMTPVA